MLQKKSASKNDYDLIMTIWENAVKATHHFLTEADFEFYKQIVPEFLDNVNLSLWEENDQIIGFSGTDAGELVMLFLEPQFIGKKYGSKILEDLIKSENIIKVDVNSQNEYAKNFYLKHGFEIISEDEKDGFGKPYPITHLVKKKEGES